jgi:5-formyltetrahydrofolate cyclo-ligase
MKTSKTMNKKDLRDALLSERIQMPSALWNDRSQQIVERLAAQSFFKVGQTVLGYFSTRQEPDLTHLWESLPEVSFGFPRCERNYQLRWHRWQPGEPLVQGKFGILEPSPDAPELQTSQVDWMLVPAVGCDRRGYRIGYGGGFYDRLFENPDWRAIPTIGITFDFSLVGGFSVERWDVPLKYVCTEKEFISCS